MSIEKEPMRRRSLLLGLAGLAVGAAACDSSSEPAPPSNQGAPPVTTPSPSADASAESPSTDASRRVLLAYFSRAGENYYNGGRRTLEVGNTEVVANMIKDAIGCDVYRINAADPYSDRYDDTVARNVREQNDDARPEIADPLPGIADYDVVLIGSPIWNVRPPMIMNTFTEAIDFSGKTVIPFVTYAVSRLGGTEDVYQESCRGAEFGDALAVRGEEAADGQAAVADWLTSNGLR